MSTPLSYVRQTWMDGNSAYPGSAARFLVMEAGIASGSDRLDALLTNVKSYGAVCDGVRLFGAVAAAASAIVTVASGVFTSADVGKSAVVYSDSAAGVITTIQAVNSAISITLAAASGITTTSGTGYVLYGTDDSAAIQTALNAAAAYTSSANATNPNQPIGTGRPVVLVPGIGPSSLCLFATQLSIPSGVEFNCQATLANMLASRNAPCILVSAFAVIRRLELENLFGTGVSCGTVSLQAHIYIDDIRVWHSLGSTTAPAGLNGSTSTTGGTLSANTRYYVVTAIDSAGGETLVSNEVSVVTTGTTSANTLTWTAFVGAVSYRIYRGTASGAQNLFFTSATNSFVDTGGSSSNGYPVGPGTALRLNGFHYEINTLFLKVARLGVYHAAGSDCAVNICYAVGCVTGIRCNATNQLHYNSVFLDTCGGAGSLGGVVLDNGCTNNSFHIQAFCVNGVSLSLSPVVNLGPLTSTAKQIDIRVVLQAASLGGTGLSIANSADVTADVLLTNTAYASSGGPAFVTGIAYGSGLSGELLFRAVLSTAIAPYSGTVVGSLRYTRGGIEYAVHAGAAPALAALAAAGTSAPTPTGTGTTDVRGTVSLGSGTGPAAGAQASVTFASATGWVAAPKIVVSAGNAATALLAPYVSAVTATGFQIGFANAPTATQTVGTYLVTYAIQG